MGVATATLSLVVTGTGAAATDHGAGSLPPPTRVRAAGTGAQPAFTTFSLASAGGVTCPGSTACTNTAAEPAIRATADGTFYASSENGLGGGTSAWTSTDGGAHYLALGSPNATSVGPLGTFGPAGGDTDLAVAPQRNAQGRYNVYVASLSLANVDVSTSSDGGATWRTSYTSATVPVDDREWIAADGASKVCISYHDIATDDIDVSCSTDAGATFTQPSAAIDPAHAYLLQNNEIGNLVIDPSSHVIYQVFSGIASASEVATATAGTTGYHAVWMGVSTDGGRTFVDHLVYANPDPSVSYGHQFVNVSVDKAGTVYAVFSDNHGVFYSYSTDHGTSWSTPVQVNSGPANTAIMPWSVAGGTGKLDIVFYGTSYDNPATVPDNYPMTAAWQVYFAQSLDAATPGASFTQTAATPVNHYGGVCEGGVSCTGNRDLYDDFGVAASPVTGLASIAYSDDQYVPGGPNSPGCTAAQSNTSACDHTAIATQTSGAGIVATGPLPAGGRTTGTGGRALRTRVGRLIGL
ncbi:MAG: hypothetical protein ACYCYA_11535 [Actinomycetes bacterium]